jgi:hypothetical protein
LEGGKLRKRSHHNSLKKKEIAIFSHHNSITKKRKTIFVQVLYHLYGGVVDINLNMLVACAVNDRT